MKHRIFPYAPLFIAVSFIGTANVHAQCPGFANARNPSAATNVIVAGSTPWSFAQQVYTSDNVYTETYFPVLTTHNLYVYNWGYGFSGASTICGIKIRVEKSEPAGTGAVSDLSVRLWNGSAYSPNDYASATPWPAADSYVTYGGPADLWGWAGVTAATFNAVAFGLRLRAQSTTTGVTARIDHVEVTGQSDELLPVELISFDAYKDMENGRVRCAWKCASETNNNFFTLERSKDNSDWKPVCMVKGAGNTSMVTEYGATDTEPFPGQSFYRLKQTDFDGTEKMLDIISVRFKDRIKSLVIYPSLTEGTITLKAQSEMGKSQLIITDALGAVVKQTMLDEKTLYEYQEDVSNQPAGVYFLSLVGETTKITARFLKK